MAFRKDYIKFWSVTSGECAAFFPEFNAWMFAENPDGSRKNVEVAADGTYILKKDHDRAYPVLTGTNADNFIMIEDLKMLYIKGICYDGTGQGISDIAIDEEANAISFNPDTGVLSLPGKLWENRIQGAQGLQGLQGERGLQGTAGIQGTAGLQGFQGVQGTQGLQGSAGTQGLQGMQGLQGEIGIQGVQGLQGATGQTGAPGLSIYQTSRALSVQATDGTWGFVFDGSEAKAITGLYELQGYIEQIHVEAAGQEELNNLKKEIEDNLKSVVSGDDTIDVSVNEAEKKYLVSTNIAEGEQYLNKDGGLNTGGLADDIANINGHIDSSFNDFIPAEALTADSPSKVVTSVTQGYGQAIIRTSVPEALVLSEYVNEQVTSQGGIQQGDTLKTALNKLEYSMIWSGVNSEDGEPIKLFQGIQADYVSGANNVYTINQSFREAHPDYANAIYFAVDTQTLWMGGKPFGISGQSLDFMTAVVTSVSRSGNTLTFRTYDSKAAEAEGVLTVELTVIKAADGSPINITQDSNGDYLLNVNVGNTMMKGASGLDVNIGMGIDPQAGQIYLRDSTGAKIEGSEVTHADFFRDSFVHFAELSDTGEHGEAGHFLVLTVKYEGQDNPAKLYVDLGKYFNDYLPGKGINITPGTNGIAQVISVNLDATYLKFNGNAISDEDLVTKVTELENAIATSMADTSTSFSEALDDLREEMTGYTDASINALRGEASDQWADGSKETLNALKNYTDHALSEEDSSVSQAIDAAVTAANEYTDASLNALRGRGRRRLGRRGRAQGDA